MKQYLENGGDRSFFLGIGTGCRQEAISQPQQEMAFCLEITHNHLVML